VLQVIELVRPVDQAVDGSEQYGAAGDSAALNTRKDERDVRTRSFVRMARENRE
jgi:hypothetical protein